MGQGKLGYDAERSTHGTHTIEAYNSMSDNNAANYNQVKAAILNWLQFNRRVVSAQNFDGANLNRMEGWMNGVLDHFYALSRLNWAGDNLG